MKTDNVLAFRKCVIEQIRKVLREELKTYDLRGQIRRKLESGEWKLLPAENGIQVYSTSEQSVVLRLETPAVKKQPGKGVPYPTEETVDWISLKVLENWDLSDLFTPRTSPN